MVFSSVNPVYLDPPNWHQLQQFHLPPVQQAGLVPSISNPSNEICSSQISSLSAVDPASGSIRPGSMTDRARLAKIPQPETALKCPRCESTNTKFCYFNNYSLTQPRHFCKTCRRYWTRGGALRNVPVGGGCRRNKKSKSTVKSSTAAATTSSGSKVSSAATNGGGGFLNEIQASYQNLTPEQPLQAPVTSHLSSLMETLHSLSGYGNMGVNIGGTNLNQFPFLEHNLLGSSDMVSRVSNQFYGVKMEENNVLKKPLIGFGADQNNNSCGQIWGSGNNNNFWADLSGLNNSSNGTATNLL